jgi:hypothetical protein
VVLHPAWLLQVISDLLKPDKVNLMIREDRRRGVFVDGLSEWVVRSPAEVYGLMMRGAQQVGWRVASELAVGGSSRRSSSWCTCGRVRGRGGRVPPVQSMCCRRCAPASLLQRATGATKMNEVSSRSHAVCMIIVEKCTTILNATNNTDATAAAAAAAMACDNMGLLMAGGGPSSRKAVAAAAALSGKLQHTIKVRHRVSSFVGFWV